MQNPEIAIKNNKFLFPNECKLTSGVAVKEVWMFTGQTVWTADPAEQFIWSQSFRYEYIAEDFRVFDEINDAQNLIPVYRAFDTQARAFRWYTDPLSVDSVDHASSEIAWYAHAIPENAMYG